MVKNIIFDFGGVLYRIRYKNIPDAFSKCGIPHFEKIYSKQQQNEVMDQYEEGLISTEEFRDYIRSLTSYPITDQQIDDCWNAILLGFPKEHEEMLQKVSRHYNLYLFSNTNQLNYDQFRADLRAQFGYDIFDQYFKKCYFSQRLHIRKPKAEGFRLIVQENALAPEETLFIDDSPQHLVGAQACGLQTLHLADGMTVEELFDDEGMLKHFSLGRFL